jgi:DNA-binding GntR family transcriptional regulator
MAQNVETWISRRPLHEEVAERLRSMIVSNEVGPGARLNERELTERLGVSRTPLREAFKTLAAEGLIALLPNRGAVVSMLDRDRLQQTLEVVAALEALAGELACANATADEITSIRQHYDLMRQHFEKREAAPFIENYRLMHVAIVRATANDVLTDLYRGLTDQVNRVGVSGIEDESAWQRTMNEHEEIMRALEARAADALPSLLEAHMLYSANQILAAVPRSSSTSRTWASDD